MTDTLIRLNVILSFKIGNIKSSKKFHFKNKNDTSSPKTIIDLA